MTPSMTNRSKSPYDEQVKVAEERGTKKPMTIPVLEITEIQDLTPGATAGKTIVKD